MWGNEAAAAVATSATPPELQNIMSMLAVRADVVNNRRSIFSMCEVNECATWGKQQQSKLETNSSQG